MTFITERQQQGKQIKFKVGTVTIISCCGYWKGKQRLKCRKDRLSSNHFLFLRFCFGLWIFQTICAVFHAADYKHLLRR